MNKGKTIDWHQMTGELDFNMTNDFLFRALLQEKNSVLAALSASMMSWEENEIVSARIENPIGNESWQLAGKVVVIFMQKL